MIKWEYKTKAIPYSNFSRNLTAKLNAEGSDGWQLVTLLRDQIDLSTVEYFAVFMRPLAQPDVEK